MSLLLTWGCGIIGSIVVAVGSEVWLRVERWFDG